MITAARCIGQKSISTNGTTVLAHINLNHSENRGNNNQGIQTTDMMQHNHRLESMKQLKDIKIICIHFLSAGGAVPDDPGAAG